MGNYAKINPVDFANGVGARVSIFFSGCTHHCKGCFNSELWDFNYGVPFTQKTIDTIIELMKPDYIKGLSILGGEPFQNVKAVKELVLKVKSVYPNKDIWIWTGHKMEEFVGWSTYCLYEKPILDNIDALVDGRYEEDKRDLTLKWRGSNNQRIWRKVNEKWGSLNEDDDNS